MRSGHLTGLLVHLVFTGVSVYLVAKVLPGMKARSLGAALWFAVLVAMVNAAFWLLLWPVAVPFKVLTLGLGSWLINGFVFLIAGRIARGVEVSGCLTAVLASIGVTFVNAVLERLLLRH